MEQTRENRSMRMQSPEAADQAFFSALVEADAATLGSILAKDFLLIDVMTGSEVSKSAFLEVVGGGQLRFERIDRVEHQVRIYAATAVITKVTGLPPPPTPVVVNRPFFFVISDRLTGAVLFLGRVLNV